MLIRRFCPDDLDAVLELFYNTVHAINIRDYTQDEVDAWAPKVLDRERWLRILLEHTSYVAVINNITVGFADLTNDGIVDHLYVHKDFQGQGIGSALLQKIEVQANALGIHELRTEASITAKPFFEKHGFILVETQKKERRGVIFTIFLMSKKI